MIRFENTGISSTPTKSGRTLVYTDIIIPGESGYSGYSGFSGYSPFNPAPSGSSGTSGFWYTASMAWNTDKVYKWATYVPSIPSGSSLTDYLIQNSASFENDINTKELIWSGSAHTETVLDPMTGQSVIREIPKERIVCPTIPDYEELVSDPAFDIKAIKKLLIDLCNAVFVNPSSSLQQIENLAVISDNYRVGTQYTSGSFVCYEGNLYNVLQTHTSQADWFPPSTPSLYKKKLPPGQVTVWKQPQGAHDAYQIGDKVSYSSKNWDCNTANNVWAPGIYGWTDLTPAPVNTWAYPVAYTINQTVVYTPNGFTYKCLQAHTSQAGWTPPAVPALWQKV